MAKGKYSYTGAECSNLSLGQTGFINVGASDNDNQIPGQTGSSLNTTYYPDVEKFVGIKVIGAAALTFNVTGDGIQNTNGSKTATIILQAGDVIWGSFKSVDRTSGTGGYLLYKG